MFVILPNFQPSKEFKRFETNMDISGFYLCCFQEDLPIFWNWVPCFASEQPIIEVTLFGSRAPGGPTGENKVT